MEGQYVYLHDGWTEIRQVNDPSTAQLRNMMKISGVAHTPVVTMNKISLRGSAFSLSKLEVEFIPRVR